MGRGRAGPPGRVHPPLHHWPSFQVSMAKALWCTRNMAETYAIMKMLLATRCTYLLTFILMWHNFFVWRMEYYVVCLSDLELVASYHYVTTLSELYLPKCFVQSNVQINATFLIEVGCVSYCMYTLHVPVALFVCNAASAVFVCIWWCVCGAERWVWGRGEGLYTCRGQRGRPWHAEEDGRGEGALAPECIVQQHSTSLFFACPSYTRPPGPECAN